MATNRFFSFFFFLCVVCVVFVVCVVSFADSLPQPSASSSLSSLSLRSLHAFQTFRKQHAKNYASIEEEKYRLKVFRENFDKIEKHNSNPERTFDMGVTPFTDLTHEEFDSLHTLTPDIDDDDADDSGTDMRVVIDMPEDMLGENVGAAWANAVNWVAANRVAPIKNQLSCGSCWAFAAVATIESAGAINASKPVEYPLSEQQLVDCDSTNSGCDGGNFNTAFKYMADNNIGSMFQECYPYVSRDQNCRYDDSCIGATLNGYIKLKTGTTSTANAYAMSMDAIQKGPVAIAIYASSEYLQNYQSGILTASKCGYSTPNHGVVLVGYGNDGDGDYWLVRNSWGKSWGDAGYFKMERSSTTNTCNMYEFSQGYPLLATYGGAPESSAVSFLSHNVFLVIMFAVLSFFV